MKIKVSEVNQMIKEEFQKMLVKKKLSTRLSQINEELSRMNEEDSNLEEVEAGGLEKTKSATGLVPGEQHAVKFEKIGSSLKEDDIEGLEGAEADAMGEFEAKFAEIGKAIDAKMSSEMGASPVVGNNDVDVDIDEPKDDDFEEVEVDNDSAEGSDNDSIEGSDDNTEEVDEYAEVVGGEGAPKHGMTATDATKDVDGGLGTAVKESVDEPLEGHSVAQEVSADKVNDNMEKDTHVKESKNKSGKVITEAKTAKGNIFTEGVNDKKKAAMLSEMNRMKKFAGLSKNEE